MQNMNMWGTGGIPGQGLAMSVRDAGGSLESCLVQHRPLVEECNATSHVHRKSYTLDTLHTHTQFCKLLHTQVLTQRRSVCTHGLKQDTPRCFRVSGGPWM